MLSSGASLKGKIALITGGTQGIGAAAVRALYSAGVRVALCARNLDILSPEDRENFFTFICDVCEEAMVATTVQEVITKFGKVDILINAAGVSMPEPLSVEDVPIELWDKIQDTNQRGTFLFCRGILPHMREKNSGLIINIQSTGAYRSNAKNAPYSMSKYAVRALTETLIEETRGTNIKVTSISPGPVSTNIWSHKKRFVPPEEKATMLKPEDIADIILFLALQPDYVHIENITVTSKNRY